MSAIKMTITGAETLGDAFDITLAEVQAAKSEGHVQVDLKQDRSSVLAGIMLVATFAEPYVKEFVLKFLGKLAEHVADKVTAKQAVEPFSVTVNGTKYMLPADLERMRKEQALA